MKRQARPFVVETKRSRKAPMNLWASTPLLQEELAAASVAETKADAIFAGKSVKEGQRPAEPQRRILPSLIVEATPAPVEIEEPAPRRRAASDGLEASTAPKRGRPRRATAEADAGTDTAAAPSPATRKQAAAKANPATATSATTISTKTTSTKTISNTSNSVKTTAAKPAASKPAAPRAAKSPAAKSPAAKSPAGRPQAHRAEPARPAAPAPQPAVAAAPEGTGTRPRTPKVDATALPPGQRWKRRLPRVLW